MLSRRHGRTHSSTGRGRCREFSICSQGNTRARNISSSACPYFSCPSVVNALTCSSGIFRPVPRTIFIVQSFCVRSGSSSFRPPGSRRRTSVIGPISPHFPQNPDFQEAPNCLTPGGGPLTSRQPRRSQDLGTVRQGRLPQRAPAVCVRVSSRCRDRNRRSVGRKVRVQNWGSEWSIPLGPKFHEKKRSWIGIYTTTYTRRKSGPGVDKGNRCPAFLAREPWGNVVGSSLRSDAGSQGTPFFSASIGLLVEAADGIRTGVELAKVEPKSPQSKS